VALPYLPTIEIEMLRKARNPGGGGVLGHIPTTNLHLAETTEKHITDTRSYGRRAISKQ
jgi:hypothetical protein